MIHSDDLPEKYPTCRDDNLYVVTGLRPKYDIPLSAVFVFSVIAQCTRLYGFCPDLPEKRAELARTAHVKQKQAMRLVRKLIALGLVKPCFRKGLPGWKATAHNRRRLQDELEAGMHIDVPTDAGGVS